MGTRFNSFYHEDMHPFVNAMVGFLAESGSRSSRPAVVQYFMHSAQQKYEADISLLKKIAADVVAERRTHPNDKRDLLNAMLKGVDVKTGEAMTEDSIMNNMITFLIAGMSSSLRPSQTMVNSDTEQAMRLPVVFCHSCFIIYLNTHQHTKPHSAKWTKLLAGGQLPWIICQNYHISKHA